METLLLPAFKFEVSLLRSASVMAAAQRLVGFTDAPNSRADEGVTPAIECYPDALGNGAVGGRW